MKLLHLYNATWPLVQFKDTTRIDVDPDRAYAKPFIEFQHDPEALASLFFRCISKQHPNDWARSFEMIFPNVNEICYKGKIYTMLELIFAADELPFYPLTNSFEVLLSDCINFCSIPHLGYLADLENLQARSKMFAIIADILEGDSARLERMPLNIVQNLLGGTRWCLSPYGDEIPIEDEGQLLWTP